jgi:hypothetical protein
MNRILSLLLSLAGNLIPYIRISDRKIIPGLILIITANSIPVIGVIFLKWNPYFILFIYWGESLIIGFFNILRMLISGSIDKGRFTPAGLAGATGLSVFFTVHYGLFMFVHGLFLFFFMVLSLSINIQNSESGLVPYSAIDQMFDREGNIFQTELSAVIALFISHLASFYIYFVRTGDYNHTEPMDYMMRPYKRIIIMHLTIIFGALALYATGFKSAVFIIIWIGLKVFFDLKMHFREMSLKISGLQKNTGENQA